MKKMQGYHPPMKPRSDGRIVFTLYDVILLKDFGKNHKTGDRVQVQLTPANNWYLMESAMVCFETNARPHVDFKFV